MRTVVFVVSLFLLAMVIGLVRDVVMGTYWIFRGTIGIGVLLMHHPLFILIGIAAAFMALYGWGRVTK